MIDRLPHPPRSSSLRCLATALVAISIAAPAFGYEQGTHRAISHVALHHADCIVDQYLKDQLILPDGAATAVPGGTLESRLADGADHEDSGTRPRNHFYNPITNTGLADLASGTPSLRWAYDDPTNDYDWQGARDAYLQAFTAGSRAQRTDALGNTFFALGHVIHLVQDLAQPQHTRNDAHLSVFGISLPGAPYEQYCLDHYSVPAVIAALGSVAVPSFPGASRTFADIPGEFSGFWDTGQYTGQLGFTTFASTPGLAEYSNAYFITDDTMFGTWRTGFLRRVGMPGLRVRLTEALENSSTAPRHTFPYPALQNTSLASFYPASVTQVTLQREGEDLANAQHYVSMVVRDATGAVVYSMPNLFHVNDTDEIGFDAVTYNQYASRLLPRAAAYSAGLMNYFFRGRMEIAVRWQEDIQQYGIDITNHSGETMGSGSWSLYQDDAGGNRSGIPANFIYQGSLDDGVSFHCDFPATDRAGAYTLVFHGTLGNERSLAVVAKSFEIVRVHLTWSPNSDQDLHMIGPDGSEIFWNNKVTQYGELDHDNIGGSGPENVTLKDLQPGRYEFRINYYRDWVKEEEYDSFNDYCVIVDIPLNIGDDTYDPCFVQTPIAVTMETYHNSATPVRTEVHIMALPDYGQAVYAPGYPEGRLDDSWYVTQIVTVDAQRNVTIEGAATTPEAISAALARMPQKSATLHGPRKPEGRTP